MTREEYLKELKTLQEKHQQEILQFKKEYVLSHNSVQIGDIISDYYHTIKVKKIKFSVTGGHPQCVYEGERLTKQKKSYKNGEICQIWQCNLNSGGINK